MPDYFPTILVAFVCVAVVFVEAAVLLFVIAWLTKKFGNGGGAYTSSDRTAQHSNEIAKELEKHYEILWRNRIEKISKG